jgi:HlyD family secretion protein
MKTILSFALVLGLIVAGGYCYFRYYHPAATSNFRTAVVERGDMLPTIGATGTVEPEQVVDIGSQVNGLIMELKADYGSNVEKDEVLATIDKTLYQATVDQNQAAVNSAKANLLQAKANLNLAQSNLRRDDVLLKKNAIAQADYDTAFASAEVGKATVGVWDASIQQAEAALKQAKINLGYCDIKSPVKGTIVDRRVNVGQTVVSNLSASSLFLLAKDLTKIQVWASVNEADIGRIQKGVQVHFTVDAYPNETFVGEVLQVRLNATMTQNVVTYTVVVTTENKKLKLLPYMTANLLFEIDRHEDVLMVPNAALRWKPQAKQIAPDIRAETLEEMGRRDDKPKTDRKKGERAKGSAQAANSGGKPADSSAQVAKPTTAASDSSLTTSAGTATGVSPQDWEARTEKNTQQADKSGKPAAAANAKEAKAAGKTQPKPAGGDQPTKLAVGDRQPPGQPISAETAAALKEHHENGRLWIVDGNFVRPVRVKIIATDGTMTEVRGKDVSEGMEIAIGENVATDNEGDTTNPFMPKLFKGNLNKSKSSGDSKK